MYYGNSYGGYGMGMGYPMSGWSMLGAAMGGAMNPMRRQMMYNEGAMQGADVARTLEMARIARDTRMGRERAANPTLVAAALHGDPTAGATLFSDGILGGLNVAQLAQGELGQQHVGWGPQAMQLAQQPNANPNTLNQMMTVYNGKPQHLTQVTNGVAFDPMQTPNSQSINPTRVGLADIMLKGAQAGQANAGAVANAARAGASNAAAALDRARIPVAPLRVVNGSAGPSVVNLTNPASAQTITAAGAPIGYKPSAAAAMRGGSKMPPGVDPTVVAQARQRLAAGADPGKMQQYLVDHGRAAEAKYLFGTNAAGQSQ